ncbi:MAG: hypothetical protein ABI693_33860 [Bryobacteraceae bacterium]
MTQPIHTPASAYDKGPIEILCKEIGFRFDKGLETPEMLMAFVSVLVAHIAEMRWLKQECVSMGAIAPSADSEEVLKRVLQMLAANDQEGLKSKAAEIHDYIHRVALMT